MPLPAKSLSVPPLTVMSLATKFVVTSLDVNVRAIEESLVVDPSVTPEVVLAMVIVGTTLSYVQLNSSAIELGFPAASVNTPAATLTVVAPCPDGVNIDV